MESALSISTTNTTLTLFTISRALNRHFFKRIPTTHRTPRPNTISTITLPFASLPRNSLGAVPPPQIRCRVDCMSSSAVSFGTGGGGDVGGGDGGGGGGSGGSDGGDSKSKFGGGGGEELSALPPDVIILDVGGMTCGGCAASVKRILESQPEVSSASVNLTTETAIVWPVSEAKVIPNWQQQLGEALAKHLTSCGFESNLRGEGAIEGDFSP